jgi:hypothetical protein
MGKKQVAVSLRKPPPADPDAFVAGADKNEVPGPVVSAAVAAVASTASRVAEGPSVATRVGERREVTVYLPPELARKLSVRCLELDRDVSNVVADAIAEALAPEVHALESVPSTTPRDVWTSRARALVIELRARLPRSFPFVPFARAAS